MSVKKKKKAAFEIGDLLTWKGTGIWKNGQTIYCEWDIYVNGTKDEDKIFKCSRTAIYLVLEKRIYKYPKKEWPDEEILKVLDVQKQLSGWCESEHFKKWKGKRFALDIHG